MFNKREIGRRGENLAAEFLQRNNYDIMERNFQIKQGEIDIIAWDNINKELSFIEVKSRNNKKWGEPIEAVDLRKRRKIREVAQYYLSYQSVTGIKIRFDVIQVYLSMGEIYHNKDCF